MEFLILGIIIQMFNLSTNLQSENTAIAKFFFFLVVNNHSWNGM